MNNKFKLLPLVPLMMSAFAVQAQQLAYSSDMVRALIPNGSKVDLSFFEKGFDILPGVHKFQIYVNGDPKGNSNVEMREYQGKLEPVLKASHLRGWNIKPEVYDRILEDSKNRELFPLQDYIKGVKFELDTSEMILNIFIPQIFLAENDGWVDIAPIEQWDNGETAGVLNYTMSASHNRARGGIHSNNSNLNANFDGRLNFGAWRLHSSGSFFAQEHRYQGGKSSYRDWELWNTYLQRDLPQLTGSLQIGEITTAGDIFDSVPMRGARLFSNELMLPSYKRSFAPVIEGIANTNAQIEIRQNGHTVYTINVAAGPFRLENLPAFGNYGDLEVVIKEADGTERIMHVPYSSVPMMLKEGEYRYDFSVGKYYRKGLGDGSKDTPLIMGTLTYGLPHDITVYGGGTLANGYKAAALGVGTSLGRWGALAADVVQSYVAEDAKRGLQEGSGAAWRVRYEKTLMDTGTTVNLANYQYLTGKYMSLPDYAEYGTYSYYLNNDMKSRWQLSLSQQLGTYGSLYLGGQYAQYRGDGADTKSFNIGYNTSFKGVGFSLNYYQNYIQSIYDKKDEWKTDKTVMLSINIPLDLLFGGYVRNEVVNNTNITYQGTVHRDAYGDKEYSQSVVLNGFAGDFSWNIAQELGGNEDRSSAVRLAYSGDHINTDIGYSITKGSQNYQFGVSGGLLLHRTGITPTKPIYDSAVLVEVPGVSGVKITESMSSTTDYFGHGVLSYLSNYTRNEINIDPSSLPEGAMLLDSASRTVVPTEGSVIRLTYPVRIGQQCVFRLLDTEGSPLPFGTVIRLVGSDNKVDPFVSGMVGADGRLYLTGLPKNGVLQADVANKGTAHYQYELPTVSNKKEQEFVPVTVMELSNPIFK